jgi:hypothetical protein
VNVVALPNLAELAGNPERVAEIPPAIAATLLGTLAGVQCVLLTRALAPSGDGSQAPPVEDRLLTATEAAVQLGHSRDSVYRDAERSPFTVLTGRDLRFSPAMPAPQDAPVAHVT